MLHPCHAAYSVLPRLTSRSLGPACCRLLATATAAPDVTRVPMDLTAEGCVFPELLQPRATAVLIGVDPDVNGALATLRWHNSGALAGASALQLAAAAEVEIHDMPIELWKLKARDKKHPDPVALNALLRDLAAQHAHEGRGLLLRAAVEYTTPQHLSGKYAWYGIGFSAGMFSGLMVSLGLPFQRVNASDWKRQMGLYRQGKEGSLALAAQLFPAAAERYLRRKKDHGRAEALLIAAWALGVRASLPTAALESEASQSSDEFDESSTEESDEA